MRSRRSSRSINDYQLTIASAVEEQTATTNEMSRNVAEASTGSGEIATNISGVAAAAVTTTQAVNQTLAAIDELARMAADAPGRGLPVPPGLTGEWSRISGDHRPGRFFKA